jgi:predicted HD phosphohydrolase
MTSASGDGRAGFTALKDVTAADLRLIVRSAEAYGATRAQRAGMDEEYVACALLHDIGDTLGAYNHPEIGAAILRPFVTEAHHWMVLNHAVFQGYYYFHHAGLDRHARERFRGSPHFDLTADFCERFDQAAFDPGYDSLPLEAFAPIVRRVFARPRTSTYHAPPQA